MASVSYRKVGSKWHIRFRKPGHKELTKTYPGNLQERTIAAKAGWWKEQIALGREDPWQKKATPDHAGSVFTLSEAIEWYINDGLTSGKWKVDSDGHSHTATTNRSRLEYLLDELGDIPVRDIDTRRIQSWLISKKKANGTGTISPVTMKSWKITINSFLRWLYENQYIGQLHQVILPKQIKDQAKNIISQPSGITEQQMYRFCRAAAGRIKRSRKYGKAMEWIIPCAQLLFWTMLRHDEVLNLYPQDFSSDLEYLTIGHRGSKDRPRFIPKSGIATVPLLEPARKVIRRFDLHNKPAGKPIFDYSYDYLNVAFRRVSKEAFQDKLFPPHSFRHGGIIWLRSVVNEPGLVTQLARHASQETTERIYGGVDPVYLKKAVDRAPVENTKIVVVSGDY